MNSVFESSITGTDINELLKESKDIDMDYINPRKRKNGTVTEIPERIFKELEILYKNFGYDINNEKDMYIALEDELLKNALKDFILCTYY